MPARRDLLDRRPPNGLVGGEEHPQCVQQLRGALDGQALEARHGAPRSDLQRPRHGLVDQAGIGRGLQFELFRPGQTAVKDYYAELPISVRVSGRYHDLGAFAGDIANLPRIVTLNNLNLTAQRDGVLALDATAKTYRYLDEEELAAQRKARQPAAKK